MDASRVRPEGSEVRSLAGVPLDAAADGVPQLPLEVQGVWLFPPTEVLAVTSTGSGSTSSRILNPGLFSATFYNPNSEDDSSLTPEVSYLPPQSLRATNFFGDGRSYSSLASAMGSTSSFDNQGAGVSEAGPNSVPPQDAAAVHIPPASTVVIPPASDGQTSLVSRLSVFSSSVLNHFRIGMLRVIRPKLLGPILRSLVRQRRSVIRFYLCTLC